MLQYQLGELARCDFLLLIFYLYAALRADNGEDRCKAQQVCARQWCQVQHAVTQHDWYRIHGEAQEQTMLQGNC